MPTKTEIDQHNMLHQHFPGDCCLCKKAVESTILENKLHDLRIESDFEHTVNEGEIKRLKEELLEAVKTIIKLEKELSEAEDIIRDLGTELDDMADLD